MASTEAWWKEIKAFAPRGRDEALDGLAEVLTDMRDAWVEDCGLAWFDANVVRWEAFIRDRQIALAIEQCCLDGERREAGEVDEFLHNCPPEIRKPFMQFLEHCPEPVIDYLFLRYYFLVQNVRLRVAGTHEWEPELDSGSPELLASLMFKWGPRHTRHRWVW